MTLSIKTIATNMITDILNGETQSIAFWSDVEKIVKATGEIAAAVWMTRINTLKCHSRNKKLLTDVQQEFIAYLVRI